MKNILKRFLSVLVLLLLSISQTSDANKFDHKRSIFLSCLKFKNQAPYLIINCEKLIEDDNFENIYFKEKRNVRNLNSNNYSEKLDLNLYKQNIKIDESDEMKIRKIIEQFK